MLGRRDSASLALGVTERMRANKWLALVSEREFASAVEEWARFYECVKCECMATWARCGLNVQRQTR